MANKPTNEEPATEVVAEQQPVIAAKQTSGATRWVLTSIAGVGLLVMGLLGGILIGQQSGFETARAEGRQMMTEHQQSNQQQKFKDHLREHMQDRRDNRQGQQGPRSNGPNSWGPGSQGPAGQPPQQQPAPAPSPGQTTPGGDE